VACQHYQAHLIDRRKGHQSQQFTHGLFFKIHFKKNKKTNNKIKTSNVEKVGREEFQKNIEKIKL
jgi:hypothetical protein